MPTFRNSLLLAGAWLLLIPVIRGISNLDKVQSAQCLAQSVSLVGLVIMAPAAGRELDPGIRELLASKPWPYLKTVTIRFLCSTALTSLAVLAFTFVMKSVNCRFPYLSFTAAAILYAGFLGLLGMAGAQLGGSTAVGYLSAAGYWSLCQLQIIREGDGLYIFPVINGEIQAERILLLGTVDLILGIAAAYLAGRRVG